MPLALRLRGLWNNAYVLLSLTALFWAGNSVVGRAARDLVPPVALAFWRWFFAFLFVVGFAWPHIRRDRPILLANWRWLLMFGLLAIAGFNTLLYSGLQHTEALNSLLLQSAQPPFILLTAFLLFRDRAAPRQIIGVLLSLAGVLVVVSRGDPDVLLHLRPNPGDALIMLAISLWVLYSVLLRFRPEVHPLSFLAVTFAIGWVFILPIYGWELAHGRRIVVAPASFGSIAYVSIFPSLLAYACFNRGVELIGPGRAAVFLNLMPLFGALLAVGLLGERFTSAHMLGMALIGAGIALARKR